MRALTFLLFCIACLLSPTAHGEEKNGPLEKLFLPLYEAVLTKLLSESPPTSAFTLALEMDLRDGRLVPLPKEMEDKLLKIKGVDKKFFVPTENVSVPNRTTPVSEDGTLPGVTQHVIDRRVEVCSVGSIIWRGRNEVLVSWNSSSGPLAGVGGTMIFHYTEDEWIFSKSLDFYEY